MGAVGLAWVTGWAAAGSGASDWVVPLSPAGSSLNVAASAPASPTPVLLIRRAGPSRAEVIVRGAAGLSYVISKSADLRTWTPWSTNRTDLDGVVRVEFSALSLPGFFRAEAKGMGVGKRLSPEAAIGRRLFSETRFAQYFWAHGGADLNRPLLRGDPILDETLTMHDPVRGAFAGQSMSCRSCHFVAEQTTTGLGIRAYADFAIRSPIPEREDGWTRTLRNTPPLVNAMRVRPGGQFLHFDGEFPSGESLTIGTFIGRNFGWLDQERPVAVRHIARVIREDNGIGFGGPEYGGAYGRILLGTDPGIPPEFRVPETLRIDVQKATDDEILVRVGELVDAFLRSLEFSKSTDGEYQGSPYDVFLMKNRLPRLPAPGETDLAYSRRLRGLLEAIGTPVFVGAADGTFRTHAQSFTFGQREWDGLRMFLAEPSSGVVGQGGRTGNCLVCHPAPHFTDLDFHNTGAAQWEYDSVHGEGAFAEWRVPGFDERQKDPKSTKRYRSIPLRDQPDFTDLGVWAIYAQPEYPGLRAFLDGRFAAEFGAESLDTRLARTVGMFKTPGLRDLGHSAPYLHTGQSSTLESVIFFYRFTSDLAREGKVRSGDSEMARISLGLGDAGSVAAFLRSLNEDFED